MDVNGDGVLSKREIRDALLDLGRRDKENAFLKPKELRDLDDKMTGGEMEYRELMVGVAMAVRVSRRFVATALDRPLLLKLREQAPPQIRAPLFQCVGATQGVWVYGVDCDHIAAIDNVARKLAYSGKPAALVGLWFSLGHSTMVLLLCGIVATGSSLIRSRVDAVATTGAVVSAVFSSVTLTLIGAFNLATVGPQFRAWRRAANKEQREHHHNHNAELIDEGEQVRVEVTGGLFARCGCCKRLLASVDAAWKMYFVGVLFGLGFETASEVGLLALAAVGPAAARCGAHWLSLRVRLAPGLYPPIAHYLDSRIGITAVP